MANMEGAYPWESATPMPSLKQRSKDPDWERKQRNREYRVAARREKRNRKADEKKQRKLNATILRRMTRNSEKYNKNSERNRLRAIDIERRKIRSEAVRQAERLAGKHDVTGHMFNVGPVLVQEDGSVVSVEALRRREERQKEKEARAQEATQNGHTSAHSIELALKNLPSNLVIPSDVDAEKYKRVAAANMPTLRASNGLSKTQQKKLQRLEPRPPPPKPFLPSSISLPEGEINWIELWDLPDNELEKRVTREKKRKANERKVLRQQQKSGKIERRAARDEKRKVYRDLKETWKLIKADEKKHKLALKAIEDREARLLAIELNGFERQRALAKCAEMGFTIENTEGIDDIKPIVRGIKGASIDWNALEIGEGLDIRPKGEQPAKSSNRVDLSKAAREDDLEYIGAGSTYTDLVPFAGDKEDADEQGDDLATNGDHIVLDTSGQGYQTLNYNHRVRRKIRRALELSHIQKEQLVRERAIEHCENNDIPVPAELKTSPKPVHEKGGRLLEDGTLETQKKERTYMRLQLAEFNAAAKVLRRQAKEIALEAGLRIYAEATGKIPKRSDEHRLKAAQQSYGEGWHQPAPPNPDDLLQPSDVVGAAVSVINDEDVMDVDDNETEEGFELHGVKF